METKTMILSIVAVLVIGAVVGALTNFGTGNLARPTPNPGGDGGSVVGCGNYQTVNMNCLGTGSVQMCVPIGAIVSTECGVNGASCIYQLCPSCIAQRCWSSKK